MILIASKKILHHMLGLDLNVPGHRVLFYKSFRDLELDSISKGQKQISSEEDAEQQVRED